MIEANQPFIEIRCAEAQKDLKHAGKCALMKEKPCWEQRRYQISVSAGAMEEVIPGLYISLQHIQHTLKSPTEYLVNTVNGKSQGFQWYKQKQDISLELLQFIQLISPIPNLWKVELRTVKGLNNGFVSQVGNVANSYLVLRWIKKYADGYLLTVYFKRRAFSS